MTVHRSVTLWKNLGVRCLLVPRLEPESECFEVQLIRGRNLLDVQIVSSVEAAYPIAQRWQLENRSRRDSTSAAA
jgi:hypothetical protein